MSAASAPKSPPRHPSIHYSDRVVSDAVPTPETKGSGPISAPESLSLAASAHAPRSPERAQAKPRVTPDRLRLAKAELTDREWSILYSLELHPFLQTRHLQQLHFVDHATESSAGRVARRVLKRMAAQRLIEPLERRVGGVRAGSASYVWRIALVGDRLLKQQSGDGIRARRKEPSAYFLAHRLAVADVHLALLTAARAGRLELVGVQTEPTCWRPYLGGHGGREVLKPDLFAMTASGDFEDSWFVEVDRGTESLPTLLRKCAQYETYRRTGLEQQTYGVFPLVVWQLPNEARLAKLAAAIRAARSLDGALYRLTTPDGLIDVVLGATS